MDTLLSAGYEHLSLGLETSIQMKEPENCCARSMVMFVPFGPRFLKAHKRDFVPQLAFPMRCSHCWACICYASQEIRINSSTVAHNKGHCALAMFFPSTPLNTMSYFFLYIPSDWGIKLPLINLHACSLFHSLATWFTHGSFIFALSRTLIAFVFFGCKLFYLELRPIMLHGTWHTWHCNFCHSIQVICTNHLTSSVSLYLSV